MPRKSKGRGKGGGRGRGRGNDQQETRPGGARKSAESNDPPFSEQSEQLPSLSQAPAQPVSSQNSQKKEQSVETVKQTSGEGDFITSASTTVKSQSLCQRAVKSTPKRGTITQGATAAKSNPYNAENAATIVPSHGATAQGQSQTTWRPPPRPGFGKVGRPINLNANFFELRIPRSPSFCMYHYDVEIEPAKCPQRINHKIIEELFNIYGKEKFGGRRPAFDGKKNIYSREKLPVGKDGITLDVNLPREDGSKDRKFKVTIKFAAYVNMENLMRFLHGELKSGKLPQENIQALNVVLRQQPNLCYTSVGRFFFPPPGTHCLPGDLGGGCEVWFGFRQSVRPSQWKTVLVNIDVSRKGFYKEQGMIEFIYETLNLRGNCLEDPSWKMKKFMREILEAEVKGLRVETSHLGYKRKYAVTGISTKSAKQHQFVVEDNGTQSTSTVEKYFHDQYKIELRYPHIPCLNVGKDRLLPMEVCKLVPCQKRKLTEQQIASMIKKTARPAYERQKNIQSWAKEIQKSSEEYLCSQFGMSMSTDMVQVEGRVLPPPTIQLEKDPNNRSEAPTRRTIVPRDGSWDNVMRDHLFYKGSLVDHWAVFCYVDQRYCKEESLNTFLFKLKKISEERGLLINGNPCVKRYLRSADQTETAFMSALEQNPSIQLVLAIIPDKGGNVVYESVKQTGDINYGKRTQCVKLSRVLKPAPAVCSNIALKINTKMGGINHVVNPQKEVALEFIKPVIIFGADVTHPSPGDMKTPSIAAVVGSLDRHVSRYCARVRIQKTREEIIQDLANVVREILLEFYKINRAKPLKIIFYRDGVGEGQFHQVLMHEVRAVQEACTMLEREYQPGITFVVVQKRHHARLFPADQRNARGRPGNVPPGTIVDKGITHPFEFDFYLCSHLGIQGTSRPTHYHLLYDDNRFNADSLQQLTYQLCHVFARCAKSVSMPAPTYYAHLAAFRARNHLANKSRSSEGDVGSNLKNFSEAVTVNEEMMSQMYFT